MKLLFGLTILLLIAVSLVADYKWKRWIEKRKAARELERDSSAGTGSYGQDGEK